MSALIISLWIGYGLFLMLLTWLAKGKNVLLPGKIGAVAQAFAYVATYVSAVALVGFAGLGHSMGLQIQLVTMGCVWFGCWMVYKYIAWPTRRLQEKLEASTPIEIFSKGFGSRGLGVMLGALSGVLILIYCSAVFKGGAIILTSAVSISESQALWILVGLVAVNVLWGGLRAVLYTEAFQGLIMTVGVLLLVYFALRQAGGPITALNGLAALPPTPAANNGYLALSSGPAGFNIVFLMMVTSVGMWAQPQMIQRHFALKSREQAASIIPVSMLVIAILLGGALFVGAISRLILGPDVPSADQVIPAIVRLVMPPFGVQIFALAIVSASLSTASALLHVSCACLGRDVLGGKLEGWKWRLAVICGALAAGLVAENSSSIIAIICATSWTLVAAAMWAPYLALIIGGAGLARSLGWSASLAGLVGALGWYFLAYAPTSLKYTGLAAPGLIGHLHPMLVGVICSAAGLGLGLAPRLMAWNRARTEAA
ncbi:MAG: sodium:solute symporter family protein [Candidatus Adiutrix sp.]|jgi:Na+/pantothenate symporter|nr:sodium:solute symporter family protein [Candidatus Adiutrix sp.]